MPRQAKRSLPIRRREARANAATLATATIQKLAPQLSGGLVLPIVQREVNAAARRGTHKDKKVSEKGPKST